MFCKNCGTQLPNDAVFCHKCAQPTNVSYQANTAQPRVVVQPQTKTVIVRKNSSFSTALFTVLLLFIGIVGFYSYQKYHQETIISVPGIGKITKDRDNFYVYGDTDTQSNPTSKTSASSQTQSSASQTSASPNIPTSQTQTYTKRQTAPPVSSESEKTNANNISQNICSITGSADGYVNFRKNCNTSDCDNDSSTKAGLVNTGNTVIRTYRYSIPSSRGFNWVDVSFGDLSFFIADSYLACENGE